MALALSLSLQPLPPPSEITHYPTVLPEGLTEVDTPNENNHCLFWCAALALLLPRLDNKPHFKEMYLRLFGAGPLFLPRKKEPLSIPINRQALIDGVHALLLTYDCQKDTPLRYEGNILEVLVGRVFRCRVIDKLEEITLTDSDKQMVLTDAPCHITTLKDYFTYMKGEVFAGLAEIRAIGALAKVNTMTYAKGFFTQTHTRIVRKRFISFMPMHWVTSMASRIIFILAYQQSSMRSMPN